MMNGFTDKPVNGLDEDVFGVTQYISGLSSFIRGCNTPMTIAIQGDWGSGKTSMMNMVREQLGDQVVTTWFNTWQYSQFNMGDTLAVSLLSRLIRDLDVGSASQDTGAQKALRTVLGVIRTAGVIAADHVIGSEAAELTKKLTGEEERDVDMPQAINDLKERFQQAVNAKLEESGKDRLVIFIDDLDRLHPGKAVELLEILKLFLDCDRCVFVLAIDYEVVSQGVKQKYGELIGEEKGRSFFDKIIQVPFKMPVAQYDIRNYVMRAMGEVGVQIEEKEINTYVRLIQTSVGCNPRAMKRLFNAFLLLNKVAVDDADLTTRKSSILFATLCLQLSYENIYNFIIRNQQDCCEGSLLQDLAAPERYSEGDEGERLADELKMTSDAAIRKAANYMTVFNHVLDQNGDGELSQDEKKSFVQILNFSTITASTEAEAAEEDGLESHYRYYNRDIVKEVLQKIGGAHKYPYKLYQAKVNSDPDWKRHYAGAWARIPCDFGKVDVEFRLATNLDSRESTLSFWVWPAEKSARELFKAKMQDWAEAQRLSFHCADDRYRWDGKTVPADDKETIIQFFVEYAPEVLASMTEQLENP